jgi:hypothetical protein
MPDEHNAFDLAKLLEDAKIQDERQLFDVSGRPKPENIRVVLQSGLEVKCDIKYDGMQDGYRRYFVMAEIDWENYWPTKLLVGALPSDVMLSFKMPDDMDMMTEGMRRARNLQTIIEKQVWL